ncbi:MAG TPA: lysophospholipid acyltransferase family protein [Anaeromyxobacteraceae bacterium]|nr:lysophospholipid acyltransferase family protein [Anaeromyxobacteraceae bacterium]
MRHAVRQVIRVATTGGAFASFFLGGALLGWIVLPVVALTARSSAEGARRCRRIVRASWVLFHDLLRVFRVIDYDPRKVRVELPSGPCVVVANHPTLLDATAISAALPDLAIVAKTSMYRRPILGPLLRLCGFVEASDGSPFAGAQTVTRCLSLLGAGVSVLVFPEGTRSPARGLGPFQAGAFQIAKRAGVPVLPLVVRCEPPTLLRGDAWYAVPPSTPRLTVEALAAPCSPEDDPVELASRLREAYAQRVVAPPAPTKGTCKVSANPFPTAS